MFIAIANWLIDWTIDRLFIYLFQDIQHDENDEEFFCKQNGTIRNTKPSGNEENDAKHLSAHIKENGIIMMSFTSRDTEQSNNDNKAYVKDGMDHSESGWCSPPPPSYEQLTDL